MIGVDSRRVLTKDLIDNLVIEWKFATNHGERIEPLRIFLGFTEAEYQLWKLTGEPPYDEDGNSLC